LSQVVISEVQYNPTDGDIYKEFIELKNKTLLDISLDGWRIDAVRFEIPAGTTIGPKETLVLVAFDPSDAPRTATFREFYRISDNVHLVGPWDMKSDGTPRALSNGGEQVTLLFPIDDHGVIVHAAADQVIYNDKEPWPLQADGLGSSLERIRVNGFGNDPANWRAVAPSPGDEEPIERIIGDVNHDGIFNSSDFVLLFQNGEYEDGIPGNSTFDEGDWNGDGDFTTADFVVAFQAGTYVAASRPAFSANLNDAFVDGAFADNNNSRSSRFSVLDIKTTPAR
jgi:hypothetical protein